jgi:hypothetical protein
MEVGDPGSLASVLRPAGEIALLNGSSVFVVSITAALRCAASRVSFNALVHGYG